jgi:DNA-binding GntR family transcriptional regulator
MLTEVFPQLRGSSKRQQVCEAIQTALAAGKLHPGQRLIELELAAQMQVGSPTVREALIELEHLGFVTRIPNRGTFVTKLTEEEAAKIYAVREVLEGYAVRLAKSRISSAGLESLRRRLHAMQEAAEEADRLAFYEADIAFHRALWELTDNKYLIKMLEILVAPQFADVITRHPADRKSLCEMVAWHKKMMNCLPGGNGKDTERVMHDIFAAFRRFDQRMYVLQGEQQEGPQTEGS